MAKDFRAVWADDHDPISIDTGVVLHHFSAICGRGVLLCRGARVKGPDQNACNLEDGLGRL
jgi:hypothetical protein